MLGLADETEVVPSARYACLSGLEASRRFALFGPREAVVCLGVLLSLAVAW